MCVRLTLTARERHEVSPVRLRLGVKVRDSLSLKFRLRLRVS